MFGENIIKLEGDKKNIFKSIRGFFDIHSILQIALAFLFLFEGDFFQSFAILSVSLLFYVFEFYKYERKMIKYKQIEKLNSGKVKCIRDGKIVHIDLVDIVVGDIISLERGESVPADIRLIESEALIVRESNVTGKDEVVEKYEAKIYGEVYNLWEIKNILFKSSVLIKGRCTGVVVAVGLETQIGKFVAESNVKDDEYELIGSIKVAMQKFKYFGWIVILMIVTGNFLLKKDTLEAYENIKLLLYVLYLNISILAGAGFSIYVKNFFKQKGVDFFDIFSIQNIARISVLMLNDRGFLCEDEMKVKEMFSDGVKISEFNREMFKEYTTERMLQISFLCNNAYRNFSVGQDNSNNYIGEHSEIALLRFVALANLNEDNLIDNNPRVFQIPKDSERKIMTSVNKVDEYFRANVKGDSEEILKGCTHIMKNGMEVEITQGDMDNIKSCIIQMSNNTLKVVEFAYRNFNYEPSIDENIESNLVFVGLIGMENSIKKDSVSNLEICERLNIKTVLATDNNKLYAYSLSKKLGIARKMEDVLSGIELKYMNLDEQERLIDKIKVFSNIFQGNKARLVKFLNGKNETTAICTNQFTDLPALSEATVGIAYGEKCSNTIKRISDIFMRDNSLYNIISLIKSCRVDLIKINISLIYLMSVILCEIIIVSARIFFMHDLNVGYSFISIINLLCVPLNMIYILVYSKYDDDTVEGFYGNKLVIKTNKGIIVKSCVKIMLLLIIGLILVYKFEQLSILLVVFIVFSIAQFIVKRDFQKVEIDI
jgi:magnesium-transporting ATPase (P-type)